MNVRDRIPLPAVGTARRLRSALLILALLLPGMAAGQPSPEPLRAGINVDFPPYEFVNARGAPDGFDVAVLRAVARVMALRVEFAPGPWDQVRRDLEERRLDILAGMLYSAERDELVDFSTPYLTVHYSIFVRRGTEDVESLEDLAPRTVIVERSSRVHDELVARGMGERLVLVDSEPEALRLLASGRHDVAIAPYLQGVMIARQSGLRNIRPVGPPVLDLALCIAVKEGDTDLREQLNTGLAILKQTGEFGAIYDQWFGDIAPRDSTYDAVFRFALWIVSPLLLLLAGAAAWSWVRMPPVSLMTPAPDWRPPSWLAGATRRPLALVLANALVAIAYASTAWLGLQMALVEFVTPIWPPSGIALATIFLLGPALIPGVFLGALLGNFSVGGPLALVLPIAFGNSLAALCGAWLLRRIFRLRPSLERIRDALALILVGALLGTLISATLGTLSLWTNAAVTPDRLMLGWWTWWLGDATGVLLVAPVILAWAAEPRVRLAPRAAVEAGALLLVLAVVGSIVFGQPAAAGDRPMLLAYLEFPFIIWAAIRFRPRGSAVVVLVAASIAIWATAIGSGPLVGDSVNDALILLVSFLIVISSMSLVLCAAIKESQRSTEALRQSEERYRSLVNSAPDAIVMLDLDTGRLVEANPAATRLFGVPRENLIGSDALGLHASGDPPALQFRRRLAEAERGETPQFEWTHISDDGRIVPCEVRLSRIPVTGGQRLIRVRLNDISSRKAAEELLRRRSEELERSNRELERFAYVASHDLQEPLRMVVSFSQLLARRYQGRLDKDADEFIGFAVEGATRMERLISDLLAYSRVNSTPHELRRIPASEAAHRAVENLREAISAAMAKVRVGDLPTVRVDPSQLTQVFQNLIGNAVKFRGQSPPEVDITAERRDGTWEFAVRDNGIGIDPAHHDRVFSMFQRLHPRTRYEGTGIGLAICKSIVERHGGRIWIESEPGRGSTFRFSIPREEEP